jgi:hypothetical protein
MGHAIIIGFDLDGTLIDHSGVKISFAETYNVRLLPHETPSDIIKKHISEELLRKMQYYIYDDVLGGTTQTIMEGAIETLSHLQKENIPFFFVSRRRTDASRNNALRILAERGILGTLIDKDRIFFAPTIKEKAAIARAQRITHFIDDEEDALRAMDPEMRRIFFDQFDVFGNEFPFPRVTRRIDGLFGYLS